MNRSPRFGIALAAAAAMLLTPAASADPNHAKQVTIIKNTMGPDIAIPDDSPVKFDHWQDGEAIFTGQFVLTGTFEYWCEIGDCDEDEQPVTRADLILSIFADPAVAGRLPHWVRGESASDVDWTEIQVDVGNEARLVRSIVSPANRAALLAGKVPRVEGHVAIVADHFVAGLSCDNSPYYSADFLRFAKPAEIAQQKVEGIDGCP